MHNCKNRVNSEMLAAFGHAEHKHKIKPYAIRNLPKHTAVVAQRERGHRRKLLPWIEAEGSVSGWFWILS